MTIINSTLISLYVDNFVNNTQTFQINDARQLPIIIPNESEIATTTQFVKEAIGYKILNQKDSNNLSDLQTRVDEFINDLYGLC